MGLQAKSCPGLSPDHYPLFTMNELIFQIINLQIIICTT